MVNQYRLRNKVAERREANQAMAGDDEVEVMEDETQDDSAAAGNDIQGMAGGNPGTGQGMQLTQHLGAFNSDRSVTITYRQRHQFRLRNGEPGTWKTFNLIPEQTGNAYTLNLKYQWTDFQAIPTHIIGFYMTPQEQWDMINPRHRTWEILKAGWTIKHVAVYPNTQVGGTDLRWQNINPPAPLLGTPMTAGIDYPYYVMGQQPSYGPGAGDTDPNAFQHIVFSYGSPTAPLRWGVGYEVHNTDEELMFNQDNVAYLNRDIMYKPAPEWVGYHYEQPTWKGKHQNFMGISINNNNALWSGLVMHEPTHQSGLGYTSIPSANVNGEHVVKADVRSKSSGCPINDIRTNRSREYPGTNDIQAWPVGPMPNNYYHSNYGPDATMNGRDGSNLPFRVKMDDIPNPDGKVTDYTISMYIDTEMTVRYDLYHLGGTYKYDRNDFVNEVYPPFGSINNVIKRGHHMYGQGGFSHNHRRTINRPFPGTPTRMYSVYNNFPYCNPIAAGDPPTMQEHWYKTSEYLINQGLVDPTGTRAITNGEDDEGDRPVKFTNMPYDGPAKRTRAKTMQLLDV